MHRSKSVICNISIVASRKWGITIETLVSRYYITHTKKTTNWTSNRIVIMQKKYIFEVETPRTTQFVH